jgi:hypothetical protein
VFVVIVTQLVAQRRVRSTANTSPPEQLGLADEYIKACKDILNIATHSVNAHLDRLMGTEPKEPQH